MVGLTIYALNPTVDGQVADDFDVFVDSEGHQLVPHGPVSGDGFESMLYMSRSIPREPPWSPFLRDGGYSDLNITSAPAVGVVLIVRLDEPPKGYFAFTFGSGRYLLRNDAWQRAYGLRTALNLIYPAGESRANKLVSVDAKRVSGEPVRSRHQAAHATAFETFDLDLFRDLLNRATGKPADPDRWGVRVTGGDALNFGTNRSFGALGTICREVEQAHELRDYREHFAWLDHVRPVAEPDQIEQLEQTVADMLRTNAAQNFDLAPPEIVDWAVVDSFRFHYQSRTQTNHPELRLRDYLAGLKDLAQIDPGFLHRHKIRGIDASGASGPEWSVWRCLTGEFDFNGTTFVLDEGQFYVVEPEFMQQIDNDLAMLPESEVALPDAAPAQREKDYNIAAVGALQGQAILMDRELVRVDDRTEPVEVCDLLSESRQLVHVKRHFGSSDLSHLFAQGLISAQLLQESSPFRVAAQDKISKVSADPRFHILNLDGITTSDFEVVYAVVGPWNGRGLEALPFFSKINLRGTARQLQIRGFRVAFRRVSVG